MAEHHAASAGRPRDPDIAARVRDATLRLLAERGYVALRIDDVARASGVAKTTIYRRWPSLAQLVLDSVASALGPRIAPRSGDLEADLTELLRLIYASLVESPIGWLLPSIGIDLLRTPELAEQYRRLVIDPVRDQAVTLLRQGIEDGVFGPTVDPEAIVDALAGSIIYRRLMGEAPPSLEALERLAQAALRP